MNTCNRLKIRITYNSFRLQNLTEITEINVLLIFSQSKLKYSSII